MLSSLVPIFKGKGDIHNLNSNRRIELLEHAFKLYEKVLAERLCGLIDIYKMQYGFMSGRGTVETVLVLKRLREKSRAKNKLFFYIF